MSEVLPNTATKVLQLVIIEIKSRSMMEISISACTLGVAETGGKAVT